LQYDDAAGLSTQNGALVTAAVLTAERGWGFW